MEPGRCLVCCDFDCVRAKQTSLLLSLSCLAPVRRHLYFFCAWACGRRRRTYSRASADAAAAGGSQRCRAAKRKSALPTACRQTRANSKHRLPTAAAAKRAVSARVKATRLPATPRDDHPSAAWRLHTGTSGSQDTGPRRRAAGFACCAAAWTRVTFLPVG